MRHRSQLHAVIFDMDGVLVDSEPIYDLVSADYLQELGVKPDHAFFDTLRGLRAHGVWRALADHHGLRQPVPRLSDECARRLDQHFATCQALEPIAGVPELVAALVAAGVPLAVASSSRRTTVEIVLDRLDLTPSFSAIVSGDDVTRGKPDPEAFLRAARLLGADPHGCVVVEDSPRGVDAAHAAEMRCVGLDRTHSGALSAAHLVVHDFAALTPDVLRRS